VQATAEESEMDVDIIEVCSESDRALYWDEDSRDMDGEPKAGPSKPLKRGRGRPRKDGSRPYKPPSPTNEELVRPYSGAGPDAKRSGPRSDCR